MPISSSLDFVLTGYHSLFLEDLYTAYRKNPQSVDESWRRFFQTLDASQDPLPFSSSSSPSLQPCSAEPSHPDKSLEAARKATRAFRLIREYRVRGHLKADLDPLGLTLAKKYAELEPDFYGFREEDLDHLLPMDGELGKEKASLREILHFLKSKYCGPIAFEFMHIQDPVQKSWFLNRVESDSFVASLSPEEKGRIHALLGKAETYERFLHTKYPAAKRFGLEGAESLIPALDHLLRQAGALGVEEILFGMAHRGRLNVLSTIIGKAPHEIFYEFQGDAILAEDVQGSGDVKYHLGTSMDRLVEGRLLHLSLTPNPSHLEAVNPVLVGRVRAKQTHRADTTRQKVMGVLLHGDAAFSGQGLVAETLMLSDLDGYHTGGTLHIIINNQIGFTTNPNQSRSSPYCSDVAKMIQVPIIHVNGDHPEFVVYAMQLAMDFKHTFQKDVVVDMFCYRRHGHNEMDEPAFTQPLMYKNIRSRLTPFDLYTQTLCHQGVISAETKQTLQQTFEKEFQEELEKAKAKEAKEADWLQGRWSTIQPVRSDNQEGNTGVPVDILKIIGERLTSLPEGFHLHPKLDRLLRAKKEMMNTGEGFDWATAEALAFGSLLWEGHTVRLSGQDCGRGTFSQRHAILIDQETEKSHIPLSHLREGQGSFEILNSPLSEAAVLGFEYGYSTAEPHHLVMWEAQFGDFSNGAQVLIDQFLMSGEMKWFRMSGLVLLLPHGMEGQGAEHSSARLERYLQMCAERNIQVANCTTPANYFHILRRQLKRPIRKPLILMTPKSLLRHPQAVSRLEEMTSLFNPVLGEVDACVRANPVRRFILCSGKVYYDLVEERKRQGAQDVRLLRLEQLYPFPEKELREELKGHEAASLVWCQEEAQNNGAWTFVDRRLERLLKDLGYQDPSVRYAGRPEAASPATGYHKRHEIEQEKLLKEAFLFNAE